MLELGEVRAHRWIARRAAASWPTSRRAGRRCTALLAEEAAEILALFDEWGETDRSHRKLAHRGSYLGRVWVSPSTVRRVLFLADKHFRPLPRPGRSRARPFPEWAEYTPELHLDLRHDPLHPGRDGGADHRGPGLAEVAQPTSSRVEETSTQVELGFTDALDAEGLLEAVDARHDDGRRRPRPSTTRHRPILLAVSDNGPQMTSGSTREFMALCAIAQHFGRPGTPTDQAWIESLNGHLKAEFPHLLAIRDPATLRAELAVVRSTTTPSGCTPASATSPPTTNTTAAAKPSAKPARPASKPPA